MVLVPAKCCDRAVNLYGGAGRRRDAGLLAARLSPLSRAGFGAWSPGAAPRTTRGLSQNGYSSRLTPCVPPPRARGRHRPPSTGAALEPKWLHCLSLSLSCFIWLFLSGFSGSVFLPVVISFFPLLSPPTNSSMLVLVNNESEQKLCINVKQS